MRQRTIALILILGSVQVAYAASVKRAVLIGIGTYLKPSIPKLSGPVNDVALMKDILVGKFDFAAENVVVLKNEQATRKAILSTIRTHLIEKSMAGDIAILHFAGHGSQITDVSSPRDEDDRLDETIVPYDSRQGSIFDITDDEINGLMRELSAKTTNVVFILDSCHSGTAARGGVREIPPDTRIPPVPRQRTRGVFEKENDFHLQSANYVELAACWPKELAREYSFGGRTNGLLTYSIAQVLRSAAEPMTYRDLFRQLESAFTIRTTTQHAHLEGTHLDTVVFGDTSILRHPTVVVEPDPANPARASVAAGLIYGMDVGTRLKVFPAAARDFPSEQSIATIRLREVGPFSSSADVESGTVVPHARAVVELLRKPGFVFRVRLDGLPQSLRNRVANSLGEYEAVKIVAGEPFDLIATTKQGMIVLSNPDGKLTNQFPSSTSAVCIARAIANWGRWLTILALDSGASPLQVDVSVRRSNDAAGGEVESVKVGEAVKIKVTNKSIKPIYVIIVDLASDGSGEPIYPPAEVADVKKQGESAEVEVVAAMPEGRTSAIDHIKVIAVAVPVGAPVNRQLSPSIFRLQACDQPELGARAGEDDLEQFLRLASHGSRGPGVLVDAWTVRHRVLHVEAAN